MGQGITPIGGFNPNTRTIVPGAQPMNSRAAQQNAQTNAVQKTSANTPSATAGAPTNGMTSEQLKTQAAQEYVQNGAVSPETTAYLHTAGIDNYNPTSDPDYATRQTGTVPNQANNPLRENPGALNAPVPTTQQKLNNLPAERDAAIAQERAQGFDGSQASAKYATLEKTLRAQLAAEQAQQAQNDQTSKQQQSDLQANQDTAATQSTSSSSSTSKTGTQGGSGSSAGGGTKITPPPSSDTTKTPPPKSTAAFTAASQSILDMQTALGGMDKATQAAYMPGLIARNQQMLDLQTQITDLQNKDFTKDPTVEAAQANADAITARDELQRTEDEALAQKASDLQLQTLADTHEAALVDQQIIEAKQQQDEQAQAAKNITDEANARRALIANGTADDTNGINALAKTVQAGVDKLAALRQADSLEILRAGIVNGKQYNDSVAKILNDLEANKAKTDAMYNKDEDTATGVVTTKTGDAEAQALKDIQSKLTEYNKIETDAATQIQDAQKTMVAKQEKDATLANTEANQEANRQLRKDAMDEAAQNRDLQRTIAEQTHLDSQKLSDANGVTSKLDTIKAKLETKSGPYDVYIQAQQFKSSFDDAYKLFTDKNATQGDKATADAQMAFQFSHFQNIGSLRIQEVAGDAAKDNQSLAAKYSAQITSWLSGGSALDPTVRDAMKSLMNSHIQDLQKAATSQILSSWAAAQSVNRNYPNAPSLITPDQLTTDPALQNAMYQGQDKSMNDFWDGGGGNDQTDSMRTDRNNNPTAMTSDVAKTGGLVEGQDYVKGDPFTGDDGQTYYTAKFTGDPIATTIKAIDAMGFTTASGQPRWSYADSLGLNNATWAKMTPEEKANSIQKMYQREGGSGSIFASSNSQSTQS